MASRTTPTHPTGAQRLPLRLSVADGHLMPVPGVDFGRLTNEGRAVLLAWVGGPFTEHHPELLRLKRKNEDLVITPGKLVSMRAQALTLLAWFPQIGFTREDLAAFLEHIGRSSSDPIQTVNKAGQIGLHIDVHRDGRDVFYNLPHPLRMDRSRLRVKLTSQIATDQTARRRSIEASRAYHQRFIDTPDANWDMGHADASARDGRLVMQPAWYQRSRRDRFKFDDDGLVLCPSVDELASNASRYYSEEEQRALLAALTGRFAHRGEAEGGA